MIEPSVVALLSAMVELPNVEDRAFDRLNLMVTVGNFELAQLSPVIY